MQNGRSQGIFTASALFFAALLATSCRGPEVAPVTAAAPPAKTSEEAPARFEIRGPEASPITFERMAQYPEPGWQVPRSVSFSPDDKLVTYLQSESQDDRMALFALDLETKETRVLVRASDLQKSDKPLSREEELRRERQRQRTKGITSYAWAKGAPLMILPFGGDIFVRDEAGRIDALTTTDEAEIDPKLCDSGDRVAFVRGRELFVIDRKTGKETALTSGAPEGVTRGQSDFNGQEELDESSGFFWSPKCDRIAYLEVDERSVATVPVMGYRDGAPDLMMQRYPEAGAKNPVVRAGVIDLSTKKTTWLRFDADEERYLGRFAFSRDGEQLWLQTLTRDQRRLSLVRADPRTGKTVTRVEKTAESYVSFAPMRLLDASPRFVWTELSGGHAHLALYETLGDKGPALLTQGDWDVTSIASIDEERGRVRFVATRESPVERQLYEAALSGEPSITRLSKEPGVHHVQAGPKGSRYVDLSSAIDRLPSVKIHDASGTAIAELPVPRDADLEALGLRSAELVTVRSPSGTLLHGALLAPRGVEPSTKVPVVVMVYGGPGVQTVLNQWSPRLLWQHLADRGVAVFQLDNRGSAGRGEAFDAAIVGRLGDAELADQLAGADYLASLPFVDASRMAIYGHSYGGFMAALAMLKAPKRFALGIAGSPVIDWALYDTAYTERYMRTPAANPAGYENANLALFADKLEGKLFVLHALMDENVHFQNTATFIDALVAADKDFDLMVFPGERHGYRSPAAKKYALRRVVDYVAKNL